MQLLIRQIVGQPCNAAITLTVAPGDLAVQVLFRSDRDGPVRQVA